LIDAPWFQGHTETGSQQGPTTEFGVALRQALLPHLNETELKLDNVARLTGINRQSLERKLNASGTALSADLIVLKKRRACEDSIQPDQPIAEIAASLGLANPASSTRAFRPSTGAPFATGFARVAE
jgi:AraC-like DNA-binding protein